MTLTPQQIAELQQAAAAGKTIEGLASGFQGLQGYALQRAAESEARLKRIEAEVMSRGLQLARVEKNVSAWLTKQGHKYE